MKSELGCQKLGTNWAARGVINSINRGKNKNSRATFPGNVVTRSHYNGLKGDRGTCVKKKQRPLFAKPNKRRKGRFRGGRKLPQKKCRKMKTSERSPGVKSKFYTNA